MTMRIRPELRDTETSEDFILSVSNVFNVLSAQEDLSPKNPIVTTLLTACVDDVLRADGNIHDKDSVLFDPEILKVREPLLKILSAAEFQMENHFSDYFNQKAGMNLDTLNEFWYRRNYEDLVRIEIEGIKKYADERHLDDDRPMAFIGSGPLPLSAVDYHLQTGKKCDCIELDHQAAQKSRKLIEKLGLSADINVLGTDGRNVDYSKYGVIFVAALVENKEEVLQTIHATSARSIVAIRSADGIRQLLYRAVDINEVEKQGFAHLGTNLGSDEIINSTCYFAPTFKIV